MGYLLAVTGIVWAVVFGDVLFIMGRQKKLQQEIDTLKQLVEEKKKTGGK
jgi:CcmD family protein